MNWDKFKSSLEANYDFPSSYLFKFVLKMDCKEDFYLVFKGQEVSEKLSKNGNFISMTFSVSVASSEEVIEIYKKAATIKGIISL